MKPTKINPTAIFVQTTTAEGGVAVFSLEQVTSFDIRATGALVILNGTRIVQAFSPGSWTVAFLGSPKPQETPGEVVPMSDAN